MGGKVSSSGKATRGNEKLKTIGELDYIPNDKDKEQWIKDNTDLSSNDAKAVVFDILAWSTGGTDIIRAAQRNPGTNKYAEDRAKRLDNYAEIAPQLNPGTVTYRGLFLSGTEVDRLKVGEMADPNYGAVASWTTDKNTSVAFSAPSNMSQKAVPVVYVCKKQVRATPISHLIESSFADEEEHEILVSSKNKYKITSKKRGLINGKQGYYIEVSCK